MKQFATSKFRVEGFPPIETIPIATATRSRDVPHHASAFASRLRDHEKIRRAPRTVVMRRNATPRVVRSSVIREHIRQRYEVAPGVC
jgi:hypothetical protein